MYFCSSSSIVRRVQCYLPIHDLSIHYFADSRIHIHLNSSQFTEFLYYIHHNDTVNWKEIPNFFNSRFPIHGKFLVPKNVNWEVVLYIGIRTLKNLVHEIIFNIYIIRIDILHAMEKFPISFV